ncbi:hypothetical protein [Janthinobacterium sp.]
MRIRCRPLPIARWISAKVLLAVFNKWMV